MLRTLTLFTAVGLAAVATAQPPDDKDKAKGKKEEKGLSIGALKPRLVGPALTSGRISGFAVDPANRSRYFVAVASGVVTYSKDRFGYGKTVEINHGNGYVTRYAHNQRTLVTPGETVQKGQPIALIGSTGRSTGPHLHFEVLKDGRAVDPMRFVRQ